MHILLILFNASQNVMVSVLIRFPDYRRMFINYVSGAHMVRRRVRKTSLGCLRLRIIVGKLLSLISDTEDFAHFNAMHTQITGLNIMDYEQFAPFFCEVAG